MSRNDYRVPNDPFVSTSTADVNSCDSSYDGGTERNYDGGTKRKWNIQDVYASEFTLDGLVKTLDVIDIFKRMYPNDETVQNFEDIVRDEICQLFGGTTIDID